MSLEEYKSYEWWPLGREATVLYGVAGHEREFTVSIAGYSYYEDEEPIPQAVAEELALLLPGMYLENRGSRIEVHPSGQLFKQVSPAEVEKAFTELERALAEIGLVPVRG